MKKILFCTIIPIFVLFAASCGSKEGIDETKKPTDQPRPIDPQAIAFRINVDLAQEWNTLDEMGVFVFDHGSEPLSAIYQGMDNIALESSTNGFFLPEGDDVFLPKSGSVDFIAYSPKNDQLVSMEYPLNLANQSDLKAIDLLWARTYSGFNQQSETPVELVLKPRLARFIFNFTDVTDADLTGTTVIVKGMDNQATFDLATGAFTGENTLQGDIDAYFAALSIGTGVSAALLLPRENLAGCRATIQVPTTDNIYNWSFPSGLKLQSGWVYTFNLLLDPDRNTVITLNSTITPWEDDDSDVSAVVGIYRTPLAQIGETKVYEGLLTMPENGTFQIKFGGQKYGFTQYSGSGGVGTIPSSNYAASYFTNLDNRVGCTFGLLSVGGEPIWVNTVAGGGDMLLRVDLSDGANPTCYAGLVNDQPDVLLEENFDLMVWGGSWISGLSEGRRPSGTNTPPTFKGYEAATGSTAQPATQAGPGPIRSSASDNANYIASRGLSGWYIDYCWEMGGNIRLGDPSNLGTLTTPALKGIATGTADITVVYDISRFVAPGAIAFAVEGAGIITSVTFADQYTVGTSYYNDAAGHQPNSSLGTVMIDPGATEFIMTARPLEEDGMSPAFNAGTTQFYNKLKFYTRFTVTIEGATAATKLTWQGRQENAKGESRTLIDNIRVVKNP